MLFGNDHALHNRSSPMQLHEATIECMGGCAATVIILMREHDERPTSLTGAH